MYRLTERRYAAAKEIFEKHLARVQAGHHVSYHAMDMELRECWKIGYQELKDIIIQLLKDEKYRLIAASYMQQSASGRVVTEFKDSLAELYGVRFYDSPECEKKREEFWTKAFAKSQQVTG